MGIQYSAAIDIDHHGHLIDSTTTKKLKLGTKESNYKRGVETYFWPENTKLYISSRVANPCLLMKTLNLKVLFFYN